MHLLRLKRTGQRGFSSSVFHWVAWSFTLDQAQTYFKGIDLTFLMQGLSSRLIRWFQVASTRGQPAAGWQSNPHHDAQANLASLSSWIPNSARAGQGSKPESQRQIILKLKLSQGQGISNRVQQTLNFEIGRLNRPVNFYELHSSTNWTHCLWNQLLVRTSSIHMFLYKMSLPPSL